jgi:hypothetical protein
MAFLSCSAPASRSSSASGNRPYRHRVSTTGPAPPDRNIPPPGHSRPNLDRPALGDKRVPHAEPNRTLKDQNDFGHFRGRRQTPSGATAAVTSSQVPAALFRAASSSAPALSSRQVSTVWKPFPRVVPASATPSPATCSLNIVQSVHVTKSTFAKALLSDSGPAP